MCQIMGTMNKSIINGVSVGVTFALTMWCCLRIFHIVFYASGILAMMMGWLALLAVRIIRDKFG
jgi:hypothetical protein